MYLKRERCFGAYTTATMPRFLELFLSWAENARADWQQWSVLGRTFSAERFPEKK